MADAADIEVVRRLLGRKPQSDFEVVVRDDSGIPRVIRNAPFLEDGTPMPTRYWLVGEHDRLVVSRLESSGAIHEAESELDAGLVQEAHQRYASERDTAIAADHVGPRPTGGVGGTRRGLKCLHAHYAWHLAGGDDPVGEWVARRLAADPSGLGGATGSADAIEAKTVAAIDLGTNSTRLLVARCTAEGFEGVARRMTITQLGEGVAEAGRLGDAALGRVVACLQDYRSVLDTHDVKAIAMVATSAARDASNREDFFDLAEVVIGVRPQLLTGSEEGRLAFLGATAELDPTDGPFLVMDLGGGSTEFAYGTAACESAISTDMGCVRLSEQYLEHDPPRPEELVAALSIVELHLDDVLAEIPDAGAARTLVGLAGTVSAVAAIEQGLANYDRARIHHFALSKDAVEDVFRTLATETRIQRLDNPGMEPERVDVIVGGTCILVRVMRQLGFDQCLVSEADILDGLVMGLQ